MVSRSDLDHWLQVIHLTQYVLNHVSVLLHHDIFGVGEATLYRKIKKYDLKPVRGARSEG